MPDSVILGTTSTAGSSLFGGNAAQNATPGLFGLLMGLFGSSPSQDMLAGLTGGKNLPVLDATQLQNMLGSETEATPDLNALLAQLQQNGEGESPLAQFLSDVLTAADGAPITPDMLKTEFAALDDRQKEDLLSEMQALLAPPAPVAVPAPPPVQFADQAPTTPTDEEPVAAANSTPAPLPQIAPDETPQLANPARAPLPPTTDDAAQDEPQQVDASAKPMAAEAAPAPIATAPAQPNHTEKQKSREKAAAASAPTGIQLAGLTELNSNEPLPAEMNSALQEIAKTLRDAANSADKATSDATSAEVANARLKTNDEAAATPATPAVVAPVARENVQSTADASKASAAARTTPLAEVAADTKAAPSVVADASNLPTPTHNHSAAANNNSFANELAAIKQTHGVPHAPIAQQIGVQLHKAAADGQDRITIRLQPPELGRIDVKLEVDSSGRVMAHVSADNPITLDLMKRDQAGLERALADAGLKTDSGSLNFQSRQDGQASGGQNGHNDRNNNNNANQNGFWGDDETAAMPAALEMTWFASPDRVDVRI